MPPPPAELFASRIFLGPALRAQPDGRLVGLVREGYDSAFEEIVRRYRRPLERFAAAIVGGRCEDVTQDAFSKALLALRRSEAEVELRPWLYRIVRNTALNDVRDRGPAPEQLSEALAGTASAAAVAERREELADLIKRLGALPDPQRAAIVMRELEGLSHEEIAAALGVSGGAARQAIYRARAALRDGLGLLLPMPALRALIEHGDGAIRGGGAIAAGASSAGGAAGGLGAGVALKVGAAALLVAGTVGAGVAIEQHRGGEGRPKAAIAAPLRQDQAPAEGGAQRATGADRPTASRAGSGAGAGKGNAGPGHGGGNPGTGGGDLSNGAGTQGGGSGSTHHSGSDSGGSHGSGGGGGDPGALQTARSGGDGSGDGGGSGGSGSSGPSGDDGGISGSSDDGGASGGGDPSGSGGSESDGGETTTPTEPVAEEAAGGGPGSGAESDDSGSGELSGSGSINLDGSP